VLVLSCCWARQLSRDVSAHAAGCLRGRVAVLGRTIKATCGISVSHVFQSRPQSLPFSMVTSPDDIVSFNKAETNLATILFQIHHVTALHNHSAASRRFLCIWRCFPSRRNTRILRFSVVIYPEAGSAVVWRFICLTAY
jgi:hypothetical protein